MKNSHENPEQSKRIQIYRNQSPKREVNIRENSNLSGNHDNHSNSKHEKHNMLTNQEKIESYLTMQTHKKNKQSFSYEFSTG